MKQLILVLTALLAVSLFNPNKASALSLSTDTYYLAKDQTLNDDLFVQAEEVTIDGTIKGDVFAAASKINLNGTVTGDVHLAGKEITLKKSSVNSIYAVGEKIKLEDSVVNHNASLIGMEVNLTGEKPVGANLQIIAGQADIGQNINRHLHAIASKFNLMKEVGLSSSILADDLVFTDTAKINGDLWYMARSPLPPSYSQQVTGQVREAQNLGATNKVEVNPPRAGFSWYWFLASSLVGIIFTMLFPQTILELSSVIRTQTFRSLFWGIPVLLLTPLLLLLLAVTVVGMPLSLILMGLFIFGLFISPILVGVALADFLVNSLQKTVNLPLKMVLGLFCYYLLSSIPVMGLMIWVLTRSLAYGALFIKTREFITRNVSVNSKL